MGQKKDISQLRHMLYVLGRSFDEWADGNIERRNQVSILWQHKEDDWILQQCRIHWPRKILLLVHKRMHIYTNKRSLFRVYWTRRLHSDHMWPVSTDKDHWVWVLTIFSLRKTSNGEESLRSSWQLTWVARDALKYWISNHRNFNTRSFWFYLRVNL